MLPDTGVLTESSLRKPSLIMTLVILPSASVALILSVTGSSCISTVPSVGEMISTLGYARTGTSKLSSAKAVPAAL